MKHLYAFFLVGSLSCFSLNAESPPMEEMDAVAVESQPAATEDSLPFFAEEFSAEIASSEEPQEVLSLPALNETSPVDTAAIPLVSSSPDLQVEQETATLSHLLQEVQTLPPAQDVDKQIAVASKETPIPLADEDEELVPEETEEEEQVAATLVVEEPTLIGEPAHLSTRGITVDLQQAFSGSPIIYSILLGLSLFSVSLWLYSIASMRFATRISPKLVGELKNQLGSNNFSEALALCSQGDSLLPKMLTVGIQSRKYGLPVVVEAMKAEAKRSSVFFWQKIGLLNDVAIIAPMLGLLGTVLGMFYAFYDVNRSIESISTLFDGLGISVGTTVAGLIVAILSLILHSTAKYRLVRALARVENQAQHLVPLLDDKTHIHQG